MSASWFLQSIFHQDSILIQFYQFPVIFFFFLSHHQRNSLDHDSYSSRSKINHLDSEKHNASFFNWNASLNKSEQVYTSLFMIFTGCSHDWVLNWRKMKQQPPSSTMFSMTSRRKNVFIKLGVGINVCVLLYLAVQFWDKSHNSGSDSPNLSFLASDGKKRYGSFLSLSIFLHIFDMFELFPSMTHF